MPPRGPFSWLLLGLALAGILTSVFWERLLGDLGANTEACPYLAASRGAAGKAELPAHHPPVTTRSHEVVVRATENETVAR